MAPSEFKIWLDGFSHCFLEAPNKEQWQLIQEKINKINSHDSAPGLMKILQPTERSPGEYPPTVIYAHTGQSKCP